MNAATDIKPSGLELLRVPFPAHQISKLPKPLKRDSQKGKCSECGGYHALPAVHLDYVGHAALTDRLLDADPAWSWEPLSYGPDGLPALDRNGGLWIRLTVAGVTRLGYGSADGKSGGDAIKELIGDALRNAAMRFGAALDLWHKGDLHLDDEEATGGQSEKREVSPQSPLINDEQVVKLQSLLQAAKLSQAQFNQTLGVKSIPELPASKFDEALERLNKRIAALVKAETNAKAKENA